MSAAAKTTSPNASTRSASPTGSAGMGSPKTIGPLAIVDTLAATLVAAITGTAGPACRDAAETRSPASESRRMTRASGCTSTSGPSSPRWSLSALIDTSEPPHSSPAETAKISPGRRTRGAATAQTTASTVQPATKVMSVASA